MGGLISHRAHPLPAWALGALPWALGAAAAAALDHVADLGGQAMPLVLAAALASLWWPLWATALAGLAATLAFNWLFVEPRGTMQVTLARDAMLLFTLWSVTLGVSLLVARQRRLAQVAQEQARRVRQLYGLAQALRLAADAPQAAAALRQALQAATVPPLARCVVRLQGPQATHSAPLAPLAVSEGELDADERDGLTLCATQGQALGPGTGRFENQAAWYLPLRGQRQVQGAVLLPWGPAVLADAGWREHVQALCDLAGQALERLAEAAAATQAREAADAHALRSTLLASISHDYRTPLASILGAASALGQQGERMSAAQRERLAATIVDEATQLSRLTDNALQLARLGSGQMALAQEWESVEELVGAVLRRVRDRNPALRLRARLSAGLPLLRCDGVLLLQLLENLLDNALKYGPPGEPVDIICRRQGKLVWLAVRDRGPGVPEAQRERLLQPFERGQGARASGIRGAGVGLALCQAVARAHGSTLQFAARRGGGASVGLYLPVQTPPLPLQEEAA